eukprot:SAG22_NODE_1182_length_5233_cov_12.254188_8_plen_312_part_00
MGDDEDEVFEPPADTGAFELTEIRVSQFHASFPDGTRLDLDSPRLEAAFTETGVRLADIVPTPPSKFFRNGTLPELASVRFEAAERDRLGHLEVVLTARQAQVDRELAEKEKKGGGGGAGFDSGGGDKKKDAAPAADEPDSTMLDNILDSVQAVFEAKQKRLQAEQKMAAENENLMAERALQQVRTKALSFCCAFTVFYLRPRLSSRSCSTDRRRGTPSWSAATRSAWRPPKRGGSRPRSRWRPVRHCLSVVLPLSFYLRQVPFRAVPLNAGGGPGRQDRAGAGRGGRERAAGRARAGEAGRRVRQEDPRL